MKLIDDCASGASRSGRGHHPFRHQPSARVSRTSSSARASVSTPTASPRLSDRRRRHRQRRRLRRQRLHRDRASPGHRHGARAGQRQARHLPSQLYMSTGGPRLRLRKFETSRSEPALEAPGQRRLRGGHGRHLRLQSRRSLPPRGLRQDRRQLQPRRRGLPGPQEDHREDHRRPLFYKSPTDMGCNAAGFGSPTIRPCARPPSRSSSVASSAIRANTRSASSRRRPSNGPSCS